MNIRNSFYFQDLTDLGPDDALFYDDVEEEGTDGIMSRNTQSKATVIGNESLISGLFKNYTLSDLKF